MLTFKTRLSDFLLHLADPKSIRKINDDLSDARFNFDQTKTYYKEKKSSLFDYFTNQELNRLNYIVYQDGIKIEEKDTIRKIAKSEEDMLFHYANQSLFADLLGVIQNHLILPHDPDSSLSISIKNDSTSFELYTQKKHQLCATSTFSIRMITLPICLYILLIIFSFSY